MNQKSPQDIAKAIIDKYALASDLQDVSQAQNEIARAIQDERERLDFRIRVLDVQPGDALILSTPDTLTPPFRKRLMQEFEILFPKIKKIVILEKAVMVHSVVRGEAANEPG